MSPDRDPGRFEDDERELDEYEDESPRSIFSALWFRGLLAVLVLGVLGAIAVPYVLDYATSPARTTAKSAPAKSAAVAPPAPVSAAPTAAPVAPAPSPSPPPSSTPPPAATARPKAEAPAATASKSTTKPPAPAKPAMVAKAVEAPKPAPNPQTASQPSATKPAGGPYWVQVGAFKDPETARRLAARLREQGLGADVSTMTAAAVRPSPPVQPTSDRYDVVVSGVSASDVDPKLAPKGLKGESTSNGVIVRPSLGLRDAVALSRDLADAGMSVQVRRIGGPIPSASPAPVAAGGQTLHRVRVGGFADRAAAVAAMKRLEDKGFKPFIARANE